MHDPRVGRFFAVDPLFRKYPHNSTYAFSENEVTIYVELEGLEKALPLDERVPDIVFANSVDVYNAIKNAGNTSFGVLEKFAWGYSTNVNTLKGVVAEAVFGYTFMQNLEDEDAGWGNTYFEFSNDGVEIEYGSNQEEDLAIHSDTGIKYEGHKDKFSVSAFLSIRTHTKEGTATNKLFWGDNSISVEVKAWDPKSVKFYTSGYLSKLEDGVNQTIRNSLKDNRDAGLLVIDRQAYLNLRNRYPEAVDELIDKLHESGNFLRLENNLSKNATRRMYSVANDIKKKAKDIRKINDEP